MRISQLFFAYPLLILCTHFSHASCMDKQLEDNKDNPHRVSPYTQLKLILAGNHTLATDKLPSTGKDPFDSDQDFIPLDATSNPKPHDSKKRTLEVAHGQESNPYKKIRLLDDLDRPGYYSRAAIEEKRWEDVKLKQQFEEERIECRKRGCELSNSRQEIARLQRQLLEQKMRYLQAEQKAAEQTIQAQRLQQENDLLHKAHSLGYHVEEGEIVEEDSFTARPF